MKVREILELIDAGKHNELDAEIKMRWINDVEGRVACEIMKKEATEYAPLLGEEEELSIPDAYVRVYLLYAWAMIELLAGNLESYGAMNRNYESEFMMYARYVIRNR